MRPRAAVDAAVADLAAAGSAVAVAEQRGAAVASRRRPAPHAGLASARRPRPSRCRRPGPARSAAEARVKQSEAAVAQARARLSIAPSIKAPIAGIVGRKAVEVGPGGAAGQPLMAIVPLDEVWVVANFKETQLADMRPGQRGRRSRSTRYDGRDVHRHGRQHRRGDRRAVQPAAARERHRQLRQGRAARAGEDRARRRTGSGASAAARACP